MALGIQRESYQNLSDQTPSSSFCDSHIVSPFFVFGKSIRREWGMCSDLEGGQAGGCKAAGDDAVSKQRRVGKRMKGIEGV